MFRCRALLAGSASAVFLACTTPTGMCACPPSRTHALVFGSVRSVDGQPVAGAQVQAAVFPSTCGQGAGEVDRTSASNSAGVFRLRFHSLYGPGTVCVRVTARRSNAADTAAVDVALTLRSERTAPDSARVELVLP